MKRISLSDMFLSGVVLLYLISFAGCKSSVDDDKVPLTTSSKTAKAEYLKGQDLLDKLLLNESREHFTNAIKEDPEFAMAYMQRALSQPTADGFITDLNKAVSLAGKVSEGERLQILGLDAGANANTPKQKEYYKKLGNMYPKDERVHYLLGNFYTEVQEYQAAIDELKKAVKINSKFSPIYNSLGYAYKRNGNYEEAEKVFEKYIELLPNDPNPYDSYAELLMMMGKYDESIEQYNKALAADSGFTLSYVGIASNYIYKENSEQARKELQKLYDRAKNSGEQRTALISTAVSYIDEEKPDMAIKELEKCYAISEKENDIVNMSTDLYYIAVILYESGKYDEAKKKLSESTELFDKSSSSQELKDYTKLGALYNESLLAMKMNDMNTARSKSSEFMKGVIAIKNEQQIKVANELEAILALNEKEADKCLEYLEKANKLNPYNSVRMAMAYNLKGDKENVRKKCNAAINYNQILTINSLYARINAKKMIASLK